jgi:7-cyano-7-deazaguanine synthase
MGSGKIKQIGRGEIMKTDFSGVKKAVISLSGGLDSGTLLALAVSELGPENVYAVSFFYNQRHSVELECARELTQFYGVSHKLVNISFLGDIVKNVSAMVKGDVATPRADDLEAGKVVPTYVPFRNSILSSIVLSYAESVGADAVALGVQYGDYANSDTYFYWDTSKEFTETFQKLADLNDKHKIQYIAPFVEKTKADEIKLGEELGMDYSKTWTCYNPLEGEITYRWVSEPAGGKNRVAMKQYNPCGICPSCVGRADAFKEVGIKDPLVSKVVADSELY